MTIRHPLGHHLLHDFWFLRLGDQFLELGGNGRRRELEGIAELGTEVLDDGVAVAQKDNVEVGVSDGVAIDEDLGDRVREVRDDLRDGRDLCGGEGKSARAEEQEEGQRTRREVPMTINRSTSSRSSSKRWSNSSESISLRSEGGVSRRLLVEGGSLTQRTRYRA